LATETQNPQETQKGAETQNHEKMNTEKPERKRTETQNPKRTESGNHKKEGIAKSCKVNFESCSPRLNVQTDLF
jgi:hypothetical protein